MPDKMTHLLKKEPGIRCAMTGNLSKLYDSYPFTFDEKCYRIFHHWVAVIEINGSLRSVLYLP